MNSLENESKPMTNTDSTKNKKHKTEIKAVLFDAGGVLNKATDRFIYDEAAKILGLPRGEVVNAINKFVSDFSTSKISQKEFWELVSKELGVVPAPERILNIWQSVFEREFEPFEDTLKLAERLRSAGCRTGVVSNCEKPHIEICNEKGHFKGFEPLIFSCEVGSLKPGKEIFQVALDRLGLPANQVAYTDDIDNKMRGARELGIHCHLFKDVDGLEKWLNSLGLE